MPSNIDDQPTWHDVVVGPSNADPASGASVTDMGALLADRERYLYESRIVHVDSYTFIGEADEHSSATWARATYGAANDTGAEVSYPISHEGGMHAVVSAQAFVRVTASGMFRLALYNAGTRLLEGPIAIIDQAYEGPIALHAHFRSDDEEDFKAQADPYYALIEQHAISGTVAVGGAGSGEAIVIATSIARVEVVT